MSPRTRGGGGKMDGWLKKMTKKEKMNAGGRIFWGIINARDGEILRKGNIMKTAHWGI